VESLDLPDLIGVFPDRPIGGEGAHTGHVKDRHGRPAFPIRIRPTGGLLGVDVGAVIGQDEVLIATEERIDEGTKEAGVAG
jgi:hypothetical protein